ncbi:D-arabinono-1,4-lactone oxidase [Georgenia sp. 10Sc9-8]|uniref:D-arabinono-1,4-lactone oxidase n=1 Tax=Georgenia halotolerans TaxID=3028317 RepID=A0ABT5TZS3_9MICO|nr:D-arabinono-1,4-lactone oxidase [Georgenia halotolerans]
MDTNGMTTWAGNHTYTGTVARPTTLDEAADVVARARKVRAVGSRHSFNDIVDSEGLLVSLDALAYRHPALHLHDSDAPDPGEPASGARRGPEPELDDATGRVRVSAATRYADLVLFLQERGRALPNLASLPHIGIAGALATATHGSGVRNPVLASAATGLELLTADGATHRLDRDADGEALDGATVSLGALGLVTAVTLQTVPAFDVAQTVYGPVPVGDALDGFDEASDLAYSVSLFTTLREDVFDTVWLKQAVEPGREPAAPAQVLGAPPLGAKAHPIPGVDPENCTDQLGVPGPAGDRLPHFHAEHLPSAGAEIQCEYLVPRENARAALTALAGLREPLAGLVQVCEVRSVAADTAWLSPMHRQDCVGVHFTLVRDVARVTAVLPVIDAAFAPLGGRPHWGKVFRTDPARLRSLYPRRSDALELARSYDPAEKFINDFLRRWVV